MHGTSSVDARVRFVGREDELRYLQECFASGGALTLVGPGGVGKSRLAYEAALRFQRSEQDRDVFFVALAGTPAEAVIGKVATAIDAQEQIGRDPIDVIHDRLQDKPVILILDNCEHAPDETSVLIERLQSLPNLAIIATSQRRLDYPNEAVVDVLPFDRETGTAFLIARAEFSNITISGRDVAIASSIVAGLDGLAIAIDLAAARLSSLSLHDLNREVDQLRPYSMRTNTGPDRRHRSIGKVVEWSTAQLDRATKHVFMLASLFSDTFAAKDVDALLDDPEITTGGTLRDLSDCSLLVRVGEDRFSMLAPIRAVASRYVTSSAQRHKIDERLARRMTQIAIELLARVESAEAGDSVKALAARYDDFCTVLAWALKRPTERLPLVLDIVAALTVLWSDGGRFTEGARWMERLVSQAGSLEQKLHGRIYNAAMHVAHAAGDFPQMLALGPGAISAFSIGGDPLGLARAYNSLAIASLYSGNLEQAETYVQTAISLYTTIGDERGIGAALTNWGNISLEGRFDPIAARDYYERAIAILERTGPDALIGIAHGNLADATYFLHDPIGAKAHAECAIQYFRRTQAKTMIAWEHEMIARCSILQHQLAHAKSHLESALDILMRAPQPFYVAMTVESVVRWLIARRRFDEAAPLSFAVLRFRRDRQIPARGPASVEIRTDEGRLEDALGAEAMHTAAASAAWIEHGHLLTIAFAALTD